MVRISLQCGRPDFDPWVGKNPWRRACNPFQYSCPENPHGQRSLTRYSPRRREGLHWENFTNYYYMLTKVLSNYKVSHKCMAEINVTKYTTFLIFANLRAVWWTQMPMLHLSLFDLTTKATKQGSHRVDFASLWVSELLCEHWQTLSVSDDQESPLDIVLIRLLWAPAEPN